MAFTSVLKQVGVRQNSKMELVVIDVDSSEISAGTNAGLLEGAQQATITKSATGTYAIVLNRTARRTVRVVGVALKTIDARFAVTAESTAGVTIVTEVGGTDTDMDFTITLAAFYSEFDR